MNRISTTTARTTRLQAVSAFALVGLIALTGAAWMTITVPADELDVVKLDRVVISGVSTPEATDGVKQLPRVVVVGRRDAAADGAQVASACVAPAAC
ncbi:MULTISPECIES: hypothetical protein [unclassified Roseateles]|jgi:hypothetical protein|uniref:hypothetical protein n=1 Tax=unclassified Roseateles TaxID=2626991 RepID=UPI000AB7C50B|nr:MULTISPECIES: hypothetical protein [unclassified Roseateles]